MSAGPPEYPVTYHETLTPGRKALAAALLAPSARLLALRAKFAPRTGVGTEAEVRAVPNNQEPSA